MTADEITGKAFAPQKVPVCPYCGDDPAKLSAVITKMGGGLFLVIFCESPDCRKIHAVVPYSVAVSTEALNPLAIPRIG